MQSNLQPSPLRLTVFGAAGAVGSRVVAEALARGHAVTAVVRSPGSLAALPAGVVGRLGDAADAAAVAELTAGQDVVVSATRPAPGREPELAAVTGAMLTAVARTGGRLLLVGGAASLLVDGTELMDTADFPPELRPIAAACRTQWEACRDTGAAADWTYLAPPAELAPGARTGRYRLGRDELLTDAAGRSAISMEDLAVALLDEAERPRHGRARFTVAY
ncbi:NADH-flavin reductase [Kitasatospora sp. MMS16-BH015]|uniref:NAD(P)-dependent oxidoreductase n=1 Tax=Kitasatospora sp. MMS16-BH015 TaxID=2018025 RepID=UPI000CA319DA|nr:NAD(P)H-binding protein [Kitasatospora sp. MMS16-BH015]AUG75336.1 NADH-flavin reductase [Kitasatospora sp. MMS16-BH015]